MSSLALEKHLGKFDLPDSGSSKGPVRVGNRLLLIIPEGLLWADTVEKLDNLKWGFLRRKPICFEFHLLIGIRVQ